MHKTSAWSSTSIINFQKKAINWSEDQSREWLKKIDTLQNNNLSTRTFMCSDTVARSSIKTAASHARTTCMMLENTATPNNAWSRTVFRETCLPASSSHLAQPSGHTCGHTCEWERHTYSCDLYEVKSDFLGSFDVECINGDCACLMQDWLVDTDADVHVKTKSSLTATFCVAQVVLT